MVFDCAAQVYIAFADINRMTAADHNADALMAPEVFPGWVEICREIDEKLNKLIPGYLITDIKEKYGSLRYYISPPRNNAGDLMCTRSALDKADKIIRALCQRAERVCANCGSDQDHDGPCIRFDSSLYGISDQRENRYAYWRRTSTGDQMITCRHEDVLVAVTALQAAAWRGAQIVRTEL